MTGISTSAVASLISTQGARVVSQTPTALSTNPKVKTERAANDVDEAPNPLTSDILGDCCNFRLENEAGKECRDLGMGFAHVSKSLMLIG